MVTLARNFSLTWRRLGTALSGALLLVAAFLVGQRIPFSRHVETDAKPVRSSIHEPIIDSDTERSASAPISLSDEQAAASNLATQVVSRGRLTQTIELTGKISLNEDRVAHIFPLVDGRVDEVKVQLGDKVHRGELLVVVQSREVGQAMLQLFQDRLQHEYLQARNQWTQTVAGNTQKLIELITQDTPIQDIEQSLVDRPLGEYRDKLLTAYIGVYKAKRHLDRLKPLSENGAITGKQLLEAESEWNASRATMQSLVEQIEQDARQAAIVSSQSVRDMETRIAVDETNLEILGFDKRSLAAVDPAAQGETISHYPIHAPFDGTVISKDVVLMERVGPESQMLSVADLSTVWVTADIYEEHLPLVAALDECTLDVRTPSYPAKSFPAKVFYTGDLVHESSRTIALRAVAENHEGLLKPGMFVNITFPVAAAEEVVLVPLSAIQEHEGKSFVFVQEDAGKFLRCDVVLGKRNRDMVEVAEGLAEGRVVVTSGGFALKSQLLAELLAE